MARDKPFPHLTNEQVIQNAEQMYYGGELQVSVITTTTSDVVSLVPGVRFNVIHTWYIRYKRYDRNEFSAPG